MAVPLAVLLASVRTQVGWWDTGDLQTVTWIAGIPYPTGFPGYVLAGWAWTHLVPVGTVAARANALSAVAFAAACGALTALALLLDVMPLLAVLASWLFAFSGVVWARAVYADAHPVGFALMLIALVQAARWTLRGDVRALTAAIVCGALALAADSTTLLMVPGVIVVACGRAWPARRVLPALAAAVVIVAGTYAYLPLRSAAVVARGLDPTLALGVTPGRPFWDDHDPRTLEGFTSLVTGAEFGAHRALTGMFAPKAIRAAVDHFEREVLDDFPQGLFVAALVGLMFAALRAPALTAGLLVAALLPALFGGSYPPEADPERYVFMLYAALALGTAAAADRAIRAFSAVGAQPGAGVVTFALLAVAVLADVHRGRDIIAGRNDRDAAAFIDRVAASSRPGAILVSEWNWATPLAYGAYVDHRLNGRVVVCAYRWQVRSHFADWTRTHQVVLIADAQPDVAGFSVRLLSDGDPGIYELVR